MKINMRRSHSGILPSSAQVVQKTVWVRASVACFLGGVFAQSLAATHNAASVPYMPSWEARHAISLLVDRANLPLTSNHWPLPSDAVVHALSQFDTNDTSLIAAKAKVLDEIARQQNTSRLRLELRSASERPVGFGDDAIPGSSLGAQGATQRSDSSPDGVATWAMQLGVRYGAASNSTRQAFNGNHVPHYQASLEGSSAALGFQGWQLQAFQGQQWWGPGWQSSLVDGSNNAPWVGVGVQRSSTEPSLHAWLRWMGPWNLDVFVAKAQDPLVVEGQPQGFLFSGARLSMRPAPWLELGLSRGLQFGGVGRPSGAVSFVKAFFGQQVNKEVTDTFGDSSGQIAGYDLRMRCPSPWGQCAFYTQWMGEDAAGETPPMPYKFMSLWGAEVVWDEGRYRLFTEYVDTHSFSLPWDTNQPFPGYVNGIYQQGYTNGARWAGSGFGSGSRVWSIGWMDAQSRTRLLLHSGSVGRSLGTFTPGIDSPHGSLFAWDLTREFVYQRLRVRPSLGFTHLDRGQDQGSNRRNQWRFGVGLELPLSSH